MPTASAGCLVLADTMKPCGHEEAGAGVALAAFDRREAEHGEVVEALADEDRWRTRCRSRSSGDTCEANIERLASGEVAFGASWKQPASLRSTTFCQAST